MKHKNFSRCNFCNARGAHVVYNSCSFYGCMPTEQQSLDNQPAETAEVTETRTVKVSRQVNTHSQMELTFEEKAFYDILMALRDQYGFPYGEDKTVDGITVNEKCKDLARKVKEIIDTKSSFADWLNNQNVRDQLKYDIKVCLIKSGYPPKYSPEVFSRVMEQVENFEENSDQASSGTGNNINVILTNTVNITDSNIDSIIDRQ